jgi:Ca2+/Na+ antiporter
MNNTFWGDNIQILFNIKYLKEFIPTEKMSFNQRLNAISRFIIYYFILLFIYNNDLKYILYAILLLILIYYIYNNNKNNKNNKNNTTETYNPIKDNSKYTNSTKNNPFMNVLLTELSTGNRKPANYCDKNIETNFSNNLYSDIEDVFNRKNSSRQFYTNPITTTVNDQESFAKFLYDKPSCKSGNKEQCVKNINNRYNLR